MRSSLRSSHRLTSTPFATVGQLISYFHANSDYRVSGELSKLSSPLVTDIAEDEVAKTYPENVTLKNLYYFWFAPTLTYQVGVCE